MKTCNTCKNYHSDIGLSMPICKRSLRETDVVTGKNIYDFCSSVRQVLDKCGPTGIWHEPKPENILVKSIRKIFRIESI